jgi:phosphoribosylformylglycinamidine synthase subunit PurQ / glutaminase
MSPHFLVLTGDGVNCERETAWVIRESGQQATIMHINDLLDQPKKLLDYQGLALPGGFSFGDELGSGQILALKMRYRLNEVLERFLESPRAVIGICNGFQVLVKLGVLPHKTLKAPTMALARNDHGQFLDRWLDLEVNKQNSSPWLTQLPDFIPMPIRHGEGRLSAKKEDEARLLGELMEKNQWAFRYLEDVNGSLGRLAGLTDESGWVLGLMPHPEAASFAPQTGSDFAVRELPAFKLFTSIKHALQQ